MSWRWKIFRAFNYFQGILNLCFVVSFVFVAFDIGRSWMSFYMILPFIYFTIIIVNDFFNIHLLQKHYPDKTIPKTREKTGIILLILYIVTIIIFILLSFGGLLTELGRSYTNEEWVLFSLYLLFLISGITSIYILIEQTSLSTHIEKNNRRRIHELTQLLGSSESL